VFLDGATIKGVIDRLRHRGFVRTRPTRHDMRLHIVSLTAKGRNMGEAAIRVAEQVNAATLEPMTTDNGNRNFFVMTNIFLFKALFQARCDEGSPLISKLRAFC
jgi:DNA-binding MarR family transcriptional regulator